MRSEHKLSGRGGEFCPKLERGPCTGERCSSRSMRGRAHVIWVKEFMNGDNGAHTATERDWQPTPRRARENKDASATRASLVVVRCT